MQSEIGAEWLGYIESAISLRLWIYRIENLSLVCLLLQCTMHHTKIWKHGLMTKRSLSKYKDLKAEREIASFKWGHKWDYWCVRTSRYDHYMPCASIQILRCLEKDLLFLKTENQMITSTCVPPSLSSSNWWCTNLVNSSRLPYHHSSHEKHCQE